MHLDCNSSVGLLVHGLVLGLQLQLNFCCLVLGLIVLLLLQDQHLLFQWVLHHMEVVILVLLQLSLVEHALNLIVQVHVLDHVLLHQLHLLLQIIHLRQPLCNVGLSLLLHLLLQCYLGFGTSPL